MKLGLAAFPYTNAESAPMKLLCPARRVRKSECCIIAAFFEILHEYRFHRRDLFE